MERSVILVSGRVQKVGYRSKVMALSQEMGITGWVGNLPDGRVKVVAEGDVAALDRFASALKVKNALVDVSAVEVERHDATGEYGAFSKLVDELETDARLDRSAELLKELIDVARDGFCRMDGGFRDLGEKMDRMLDKQDETTGEVRGLRSDMKGSIDMRLERIETALKERGILGGAGGSGPSRPQVFDGCLDLGDLPAELLVFLLQAAALEGRYDLFPLPACLISGG